MPEPSRQSEIRSHRDLIAWQKAMDFTVVIYQVTKNFPREELFGLTSQMRRCSASIAANIAEGQGRRTGKEFQQFLMHARGSVCELDTHLELAQRVGYLSQTIYQELRGKLDEVGRILNGLIRSIA
jgi:four helix bundle protein